MCLKTDRMDLIRVEAVTHDRGDGVPAVTLAALLLKLLVDRESRIALNDNVFSWALRLHDDRIGDPGAFSYRLAKASKRRAAAGV